MASKATLFPTPKCAIDMKTRTPWSGDWRAVLRQGLERLGYTRVTDLVHRRGGRVTFSELARELGGEDLAPKQIEWTMRDEAKTDYEYLYFVKVALINYILDRLASWKPELGFEFQAIGPLVDWKSALPDHCAASCDVVKSRIRSYPDYPLNWRPAGVDDPVIRSAFDGVEFVARSTVNK